MQVYLEVLRRAAKPCGFRLRAGNAHRSLLAFGQAIEIQPQRRFVEALQKLRFGRRVAAADFFDELTFGHLPITFLI